MAFLKIVAVVGGLSVLAINHSANALLLCLYSFSWSVSVIFCTLCVNYILHAHLLIIKEIMEMFTWKTNVLSVFPLFYIPVSYFSLVFYFFYIWDPCISLYILWKPAIDTIIIILLYQSNINVLITLYTMIQNCRITTVGPTSLLHKFDVKIVC